MTSARPKPRPPEDHPEHSLGPGGWFYSQTDTSINIATTGTDVLEDTDFDGDGLGDIGFPHYRIRDDPVRNKKSHSSPHRGRLQK